MAKIQNPAGLPILFQLWPHLSDGGILKPRQMPSRTNFILIETFAGSLIAKCKKLGDPSQVI
jgi:hypothetical protein